MDEYYVKQNYIVKALIDQRDVLSEMRWKNPNLGQYDRFVITYADAEILRGHTDDGTIFQTEFACLYIWTPTGSYNINKQGFRGATRYDGHNYSRSGLTCTIFGMWYRNKCVCTNVNTFGLFMQFIVSTSFDAGQLARIQKESSVYIYMYLKSSNILVDDLVSLICRMSYKIIIADAVQYKYGPRIHKFFDPTAFEGCNPLGPGSYCGTMVFWENPNTDGPAIICRLHGKISCKKCNPCVFHRVMYCRACNVKC